MRCDLSGLNLAHANFDNAILAWSDFVQTILSDGSFNGPDLEGATFVEADLRRTRLTNLPMPPSNLALGIDHDYAVRAVEWPPAGHGQIMGPDFSCADLKDADFRGHSVF